MSRVAIVLVAAAALLASLGLPSADADEALLADGTKLVGRKLREEADRVYFELRFGARWIQKADIKSITPGPVPWEKTAAPGEAPEEVIPGIIDFNFLQRVVFRLVNRYQSDLMVKIWNDPAVQSSFMDDLAESKTTTLKLELSKLGRMPHVALVRAYQVAARRQIAYLQQQTIQRAHRSKLLPPELKKPDFGQLKTALQEWLLRTPRGQHEDKRETARLMLSRAGVLENELDLIDRASDPKALDLQLKNEETAVERKFAELLVTPTWSLHGKVSEVTHKNGWDTIVQLTTAGANSLGRTLEEIHLRLRNEAIDGDAVLYDASGFTGEFRFPIHNIGGFPAVLHRYRLVYRDKLVCDYFLLRVDNRAYYGLIVRETDLWYAAVIPE